jgi:hypothetical protein
MALDRCFSKTARSSSLLVVAILALTGALGQRFYNQPRLRENTVAPETIRAPHPTQMEDIEATESKRQLARTIAGPVFVLDQQTNQQIRQHLQDIFQQVQGLRDRAGNFPFVSPERLPVPVQRYLRQAPDPEWQLIREELQPKADQAIIPNSSLASSLLQTQVIAALQTYQKKHGPQAVARLINLITTNRQDYQSAQSAIAELAKSKTLLDASVLNLSKQEWLQTQAGSQQVSERMLAQGLFPGLAPTVLQTAAQLQVKGTVPKSAETIATQLVLDALRPNVTRDATLSMQRAEQAAKAVQPVILTIRKGDVIVHHGEKIDRTAFILLDHYQLSRRGISWVGLAGWGVLVGSTTILFLLIQRRSHPTFRRRDQLLVLLLAIGTPLLATLDIPSTSLPMLGVLLGSFYGPAVGMTVVVLLAGLMPIGMDISSKFLLSSTVGGLLGGLLAGRSRSREELALLGGGIGITQGVFLLLLHGLSSGGTVWYSILGLAALHGLTGFAWCVLAMGLSPYLEHLFDLITPIRLAELSNPNRPLLKRLATETPGTFQHTLFVATLAEAAARALKCNVELVRAGTLYHDIGKMHDPQGFIENQMSGINKHDRINNPWMSAQIIKDHVGEGLVMARKCRLPKAIQAFIPEHQGTMLIAYFYHQALERAKADPNLTVDESEFRYDGPIPQSRETGLVMLADACEAALRSLKEATPEMALSMVNKILKARWQDQQLVSSGLKYEEMPLIAEIFVQVWQQHNHQRIAYPKAALLSPVFQPQKEPTEV